MKTLIVKEVSKKNILNNISLEISEREIVALIGPNGSGKSTLMKCIMGFSLINKGKIYINNYLVGKDKEALKGVACSIEFPPLYPDLNGLEHFNLISKLKNVNQAKVGYYKDFSGLKEKLKLKTKYYSVGMRQILILCIVMMQTPKFLILDEPFNGLDLQTKEKVMKELKRINASGTTILWSSHEINQLREMSDRFVFIKNGCIVGQKKNDKNYNTNRYIDKLESYYLQVCKDE